MRPSIAIAEHAERVREILERSGLRNVGSSHTLQRSTSRPARTDGIFSREDFTYEHDELFEDVAAASRSYVITTLSLVIRT